jgi:hypothetical protein
MFIYLKTNTKKETITSQTKSKVILHMNELMNFYYFLFINLQFFIDIINDVEYYFLDCKVS